MILKKVLGATTAVIMVLSLMCQLGNAEDSKKMVAHYKFDGNFVDSSGNGLDGTMTGDVPFEQGIDGQAAQFGNGFIEVKDNDVLDFDKEFTASMWVKMSPKVDKKNWSGMRMLLSKGSDKISPYSLYLYHSAEAWAELDGNNYNATRHTAKKQIELIGEKWSLLTVTFSNGKTTFYYDDKFIAVSETKDEKDKVLYKTTGSLYIGNSPQTSFPREFYGCIDDLKLYNYSMDISEIKDTYSKVMSNASGTITLQINNPKMTVNNVEKEVDPGRGTTPVVVDNRTLVPIRSIIEAMGGSIKWDGKDNRVDIVLKDKTIKLWINKLESQVGNEKKSLDVAPKIIKERTMLPLRFVTENLGATIEWDGVERKAVIHYKQ